MIASEKPGATAKRLVEFLQCLRIVALNVVTVSKRIVRLRASRRHLIGLSPKSFIIPPIETAIERDNQVEENHLSRSRPFCDQYHRPLTCDFVQKGIECHLLQWDRRNAQGGKSKRVQFALLCEPCHRNHAMS